MDKLLRYDDAEMRADLSATEKISPQNLRQAHAAALKLHQDKQQGWMDIVSDKEYLKTLELQVIKFSKFKNCLVLGIGGSDLGARAILSALRSKGRKTRIWFAGDTTDPDEISSVLDALPWRDTCINVISKSGGTLETMSVFFEAKQRLEKAVGAKRAAERIICTTDPEQGELRELALKKGYAMLSVPPNIGGRFSVLTAVGLFPLGLAGVDIKSLLKGAVTVRESWMSQQDAAHPIDRFAAWQLAHETKRKRNIHVLFAYAACLGPLANWWRQLWAESLGKATKRDNQKNNFGPTPVVAVGPTDQHSQLQLYQDGPDDKIFTFLTVESFRSKLRAPASAKSFAPMAYAAGRPFAQLINAEARGSMDALVRNKRPVGLITLQKIDEASLGAMLMFLELATAVAGELYDVNAYDQPGVEASKHRARELLTL